MRHAKLLAKTGGGRRPCRSLRGNYRLLYATVLQQADLRVAIAIAPSPSAQFAIKDEAGNYRGVAVILAKALPKMMATPR